MLPSQMLTQPSSPPQLVTRPKLSNRQQRNQVYEFIGQVAEPGDILFMTTKMASPQTWFERFKWKVNYTSQGYPQGDYREWATLVFSHMSKESKGGNWVPFVYQSKEPALRLFRMPPGYFRGQSRLELLRYRGINQSQRDEVVRYLQDRVNEPHDHSELIWNRITFQTGLPNFMIRRRQVNCVRTTMEAYQAAGMLFSHRCQYAPAWNYARYLGRPILHYHDGVNPAWNYLQDHHLYSDSRMESMGSVFQHDQEFMMVDSPEKYSWVESRSAAPLPTEM